MQDKAEFGVALLEALYSPPNDVKIVRSLKPNYWGVVTIDKIEGAELSDIKTHALTNAALAINITEETTCETQLVGPGFFTCTLESKHT